MLWWFIRFPEFAEFLFHLGKNSIVPNTKDLGIVNLITTNVCTVFLNNIEVYEEQVQQPKVINSAPSSEENKITSKVRTAWSRGPSQKEEKVCKRVDAIWSLKRIYLWSRKKKCGPQIRKRTNIFLYLRDNDNFALKEEPLPSKFCFHSLYLFINISYVDSIEFMLLTTHPEKWGKCWDLELWWCKPSNISS